MNKTLARTRVLAQSVVVCIASITGTASAQEVIPDFYKDPGINKNRSYVNQNFSEHIDPFTGALQLHYVDVHVPGNGGFDIDIVRSYNNAAVNDTNPSTYRGSLGVGWSLHFGRVLHKNSTLPCSGNVFGVDVLGNPVIELPDGGTQLLTYSGSTSPLMVTTQRWRADCAPGGGGLVVFSPAGMRYEMTQQVNLGSGSAPQFAWYTTKISDRNGNTATISYTGTAKPEVSSISTNDGRTVTFTYEALGSGELYRRIASISTSGHTYQYDYQAISGVSGAYQLTAVRRPDGNSWKYAYNANLNTTPGSYLLNKATYPEGGSLSYTYGHVYFDSVSNALSRSTVVTRKTSSDGGTWTFAYTPGSTGTLDTTKVTTPSGTLTYRHYGPNYATSGSLWMVGLLAEKQIGTIHKEVLDWSSQAISTQDYKRPGAWKATRLDSDTHAPVLASRVITRDGQTYRTTFSSFDSFGNPRTLTETGPNGGSRTTSLTYYTNTSKWIVQQVEDETIAGVGSVGRTFDTDGNLTAVTRDGVTTRYGRLPSGDVASITDPRGAVTTFSDYRRGTPQREVQPENVVISREVSTAGNVESETNGAGRTTTYQYDGLNRVVLIRPPIGNATTLTYTATTKTATRGSLVQVTAVDGFGRVTDVTTGGVAMAFRHDALGRKTFQSLAGYPATGRTFTYDILDRLLTTTHADNKSRSQSYGAATMSVLDERGFTTTYRYATYGNPDEKSLMGIAAPDSAASVTIARNGRDLVTSVTQAGVQRSFGYDSRYYLTTATHPEVGTITYGRDDNGNMTTRKVGASGVATYAYDGRNRVTSVTYPDGNPSQVVNTYTATDKLRTVSNSVASREYGYDANDNLATESLSISGLPGVPQIINGLAINESKGVPTVTYNYNGNDQLVSMQYPILERLVEFRPDVLGRPAKILASGEDLLSASYWPNGQIFDIGFLGGSRLRYGQNVREWANSVTVTTGDGATKVSSALTHDGAGNITAVTDGVNPLFSRTFGYDALNRMTAMGGPWGPNGSASYDGAGNIRTYDLQSRGTLTYAYDGQNRLASMTRSNGEQVDYGYDAYGNAYPTGQLYAYDNASNLSSSGSQSFAYDGTNTRVKVVDGQVTTYEFRAANGLLLAEWRQQPGYYDIVKHHFHIAGKEVAEQQTSFAGTPPTLMFLQPDVNGSTLAGTWAGGGLLFTEGYSPYGEALAASAEAWTKRRFAGQTQDTPGLIYMGGRYYNPQIGRFLSVDPKEADPGDLHSLNRYAYANNNPYRFVDPDGHSPLDIGFLVYDVARLGIAVYQGQGVGEAALDVAMSVVGVMSPVPGAGQAMKTLKVADKVIDGARAAEHAGASVAAKAANGCCCLPAGTPVLTAGGLVPIEDIQVGDLVQARDPDTGHTTLKPVTQLIHTEGKPLYALILRDPAGRITDMEVTDNHPYRVRGVGWVEAAQLRPGMEVESYERSGLAVVSVKPLGRVQTTYNFTVGDYHTYFAGHAKAFVHNCSCLVGAKPDFIVSPKGTAMPTNKDFNLVDSKKPGDWFQIHNTHTDAKAPGVSHTHFPQRHHQSTTREIKTTSSSDIDKADSLLRSGQMRERLNRADKGGAIQ